MAKSNNQKLKILFLEKMLLATSKDQPIGMQEILSSLLEKGISAERKSIYDDLEALRGIGLDVQYKRGKPGGYYVSGQAAAEICKDGEVSAEVSADEKDDAAECNKEKKPEEKAAEYREVSAWITELSHAGVKKEMKLHCENAVRDAVSAYFGTGAHYKEKDNGSFVVTAEVVENPLFYGWLTAMGKSVHIQKPKKSAQAYREYLKALAKSYKGV